MGKTGLAEAIFNLWKIEGNHAHYIYHPKTGDMSNSKDPLTVADILDHIDGKIGYSIIPIQKSGKANFGAIDVDDYNTDIAGLSSKITQGGYPLFVARSKSGGAHLYFFPKTPLPSVTIKSMLEQWANILKLDNYEIFPKQKELKGKAIGNGLNLPFFDIDGENVRPGYNNGEVITPYEWVQNALNIHGEVNKSSNGKFPWEEMPPCVERMMQEKVSKGDRNLALMTMGIYLRLAKEDIPEGVSSVDLLLAANRKKIQPVLPDSEVRIISKSSSKSNYHYSCGESLLMGYCDRPTCIGRKYGCTPSKSEKNHTNFSEIPRITKLTRVIGDPVMWIVDTEVGTMKPMFTESLINVDIFRTKLMEQKSILIGAIKNIDWVSALAELVEECETVDTPFETTNIGILVGLFNQFTAHIDIRNPVDIAEVQTSLIMGQPALIKEEGNMVIVFEARAFSDILKRNKLDRWDATTLWLMLKEIGCKNTTIKVGDTNRSVIKVNASPDLLGTRAVINEGMFKEATESIKSYEEEF